MGKKEKKNQPQQTRRKDETKNRKQNTICVGHHYTQTNTNNVIKT